MRKYQVFCEAIDLKQFLGEIPWDGISDDYYGDYVEADFPEEAIEQVMQWMVEEASPESHPEIIDDMVVYHDDDGNVTGAMANFRADTWFGEEAIKQEYNILSCHLDIEDFGGVLAEIEVDGRKIKIGSQLIQDGEVVRKANPMDIQESGCWDFVGDGAIDDGTAKITEICDDEEEAWEIFESAIDEAIEIVNK